MKLFLGAVTAAAALAAVVLFVVAVVRSVDDEPLESLPVTTTTVATASPDATTSTATEPGPVDNDQIWEDVSVLVQQAPSIEAVVDLADAMGASGEQGWVPYLVDMMFFYSVAETIGSFADALAALTGEPVPEDLRLLPTVYGGWLHREEPLPYNALSDAEGYVLWKGVLYSQADVGFIELITQIDDPILASQMQWGGVRRGGIPELNAPLTVSVEQADWMTDEELTFGAEINGEVRSYPHRILDHHEMANDTLGGEPVALANCTLCRTGVLFSRAVDDRILTFQSSGLLWNSNKVMVDVETSSLWNQITGEAIAGELKGTVLDRFPITVTTYGEWIAEHPDTAVLAIPADGPYSYQPGDAYAEYYASPQVWWPAAEVPDAFAEKDEVATLDLDGERLAVGVKALGTEGPQVFTVGGQTVVAVPTDGGARFYGSPDAGTVVDPVVEGAGEATLLLADGTELDRLLSGHSFWFAWYANYPDTDWWPR